MDISIQENRSEENQPLSLSVAHALRAGYSDYLTISPSFGQPGCYDIQAADWVGQIAVDDLVIQVKPKTPVDNLFHMLTYAYDLDVFRKEQIERVESSELFEPIVVMFVRRVEDLVRKGIGRGYVAIDENERFLRGRLQVKDQICRNVIIQHRFCTRHDEFTADILENRLLKAVLFMLSRLPFLNPKLRPSLRRLLHAFDEVALRPISDADFERVVYSRLNEHYRPMHKLARLLWRHCSPDDRAGKHQSASYLLHMWEVFEKFVAAYLREHFAEHNVGINVISQPSVWLDQAGSVSGIPDVVLRVSGQGILVLDTKYKLPDTRPSNQDFYQMITYCHALGIPNGTLVYPGRRQSQEFVFKGIRVQALALDLEGGLSAFQRECEKLAEQLQRMICELCTLILQPA